MRNKLIDLNNHLFAQLERLGDEGLTSDEISDEVKRARAISGVAQNIIDNARVALEGMKFVENYTNETRQLPEQFLPTQDFGLSEEPVSRRKSDLSSHSIGKVQSANIDKAVKVKHKIEKVDEKGVNARSRAALGYANSEGYKNIAEAIASMGKQEFDKAVTEHMKEPIT